MKPIEDCKDDNEFYTDLDNSIRDGEWGSCTRDEIVPYLIEGLKDPEHIQLYIRENIPPELAWEMEIMRTPEHKGNYVLKSPLMLENLLFKEKAKVAVLESLNEGNLSPVDVFIDLRKKNKAIDMALVCDILFALLADGVLGD